MADRTLTINHADGGSETYILKTEDVLGVRNMSVDGETVTIDRTAPDLIRTIIADGQTITIDTTREGVRTLTVDGTEITIDRSEEVNLESFLQEFTGASAAYSLRDLAGSGNTTVVRVRRDSDNAEADFKAKEVSDGTLVAWVGAGNDGCVPIWYDQSGNGNDAFQQVSGSQPKIVDAGVLVTNDEGNPAIQGATGKSFGLSPITGLEDVSIFFVGSVPPSLQAITGWNTNLYMVRFGASYWEFVANLANPGNMDWNSALTSGDTALFNFTRSSGTVTGYANSVASDTTSNANSNPFGLNRIFTRSAVNYNDYQGKASELIIYNSDQSANRAAIETNINNQYDIY
jgi:hypothetical protein